MNELSANNQGKIAGHLAPAMIGDEIKRHLEKFTAFSNPSLAYFGIGLTYSVEITLYSRGEEVQKATATQILTAPDSAPVPADVVITKLPVVEGKKMAGRGPGRPPKKYGEQTLPQGTK